MPVEGANLPQHIAGAEQSQALQHAMLQQERAQAQAAAEASRDHGKAEASSQVKETEQVEDKIIEGKSRGAHSYDLKKNRKEKGKPKQEKSPVEEPPEDPKGRGQHLDMEI